MSEKPIRDGFDELASGALSRAPNAAVDAYRHYFYAGAAHLLFLLTEPGASRTDYEAMVDRLEAELDAYREALETKILRSRRSAGRQ